MDVKYHNKTRMIEYCLSPEEIFEAIETSIKKAEKTMSYSQNAISRSMSEKIDKQLQGIISEMIVENYLNALSYEHDNVSISRYDNIRTDNFNSSKDEYDIKMHFYNADGEIYREFDFEIRSSRIWRTPSNPSFRAGNIIGPYTNQHKNNEAYSDFYIKPVIYKGSHKNDTLLGALKNGSSLFFLAGGCTINTMKNNSYSGSLGQSNTSYQLVNISSSCETDMLSFNDNMQKFIDVTSKKALHHNMKKENYSFN